MPAAEVDCETASITRGPLIAFIKLSFKHGYDVVSNRAKDLIAWRKGITAEGWESSDEEY